MAMHLEFAVEALTADLWVITASEAKRDPVHLIGVYVSEQAAKDALPRTAANFQELHTLRCLQATELKLKVRQDNGSGTSAAFGH